MEYLHTMIRVKELDPALKFFCEGLGLKQFRRKDFEGGRFTLVFLATEADIAAAKIEVGGDDLGRADVILAIWLTALMIFTRFVNICQVWVIRSTARRAMDAWLLLKALTVFPLSCYKKAPPSPRKSHGSAQRMTEHGSIIIKKSVGILTIMKRLFSFC